MLFGEGTADHAAAERLMAACLERGVNFFDSAEMVCYCVLLCVVCCVLCAEAGRAA